VRTERERSASPHRDGVTPARPARADVLAWAALVLLLGSALGWGLDPQFGWDVDNAAPGSVLRFRKREELAENAPPRQSKAD